MFQNILSNIIYLSAGFSFLSFAVGCMRLKKLTSYNLMIFFTVLISTISDTIGYFTKASEINNLIVFRIYTLIEFSLIAAFYIKFYKQYFSIKHSYIIYIVIALICFIDYLLNGHEVMDSFSATTESFVLMSVSLVSFYFIMRNLITDNIIQLPFFWFNAGILIYFSGNILLFIFSNTLQQEIYFILWAIIHSLMNIIYNTCISIGFIKTKQI